MTQIDRVGHQPRAPWRLLRWIVAAGVFALIVAGGLLVWWYAGAVTGIMFSLFAMGIGLAPAAAGTRRPR